MMISLPTLVLILLLAASSSTRVVGVVGDVQLPKFINQKDLTTRVTGFASSRQTSLFGIPHSHINNNSPLLTGSSSSSSSSSICDPGNGDGVSSSILWAHYSPSEGQLYLQSNRTIIKIIADKERSWECKTLNKDEAEELNAETTAKASSLDIASKASLFGIPQNVISNVNDNEGNSNNTSTTTATNNSIWIPLEGLFGMYRIPSGTIWVLITGSEEVYDMNLNAAPSPPLMQIRRVTSLELVHIPYQQHLDDKTSASNNNNNPQQLLKEEIRQVQLLRKALKQHIFYYMANTNNGQDNNNDQAVMVPDMTKNLQKVFAAYNDNNAVEVEPVEELAASEEQPEEKEEEEEEETVVEINATTPTAAAAAAAATTSTSAIHKAENTTTTTTTTTTNINDSLDGVEEVAAAGEQNDEEDVDCKEDIAVELDATSTTDAIATTPIHDAENTSSTATAIDISGSSSSQNNTSTIFSQPEVNNTATATNTTPTPTPTLTADTEDSYYSLSGFPSRSSRIGISEDDKKNEDAGENQKSFWEDWFGFRSSSEEEVDTPDAILKENVTEDAIEAVKSEEKEDSCETTEDNNIHDDDSDAHSDADDDSDADADDCSSKIMYWWEDVSTSNINNAAKPDSRFFWNEAAVQPLIKRYNEEKMQDAMGTDDGEADCNKLLLKSMIPLTSAFVGVQRKIALKDNHKKEISYDQLLISRRSRFRAGTRFTKRGADATGAVANYAETEQICLVYKGDKPQQLYSHIQTRGSIPLRWSSPTDIKTYRPRVRIGMDPMAQTRALLSHVVEQMQLYTTPTDGSTMGSSSNASKLVFVNLIDKKSDQGRLGRAFDAVLNAVMEVYAPPNVANSSDVPGQQQQQRQVITLEPNSIEHVWFDFHAEVKNGRWDRLSKLLKKTKPSLLEHGYFCVQPPTGEDEEWNVICKQNGVVRTNCMDCLDRTNVVQSLYGRSILFDQLAHFNATMASTSSSPTPGKKNRKGGIALPAPFLSAFQKSKGLTLPWESGEVSHRALWADNADAISRLYAGTAALKRDFTRTGKRTKLGALDDGVNSLQRYYLNNFLDADRQEGYDLLVGYQEFSNLDGNQDDLSSSASSSSSSSSGDLSMSLQEAARQMFLGNNFFNGRHDDDERHYQRIKDYKLSGGGGSASCSHNGQQSHKPRPLDLRWLPGDLQDQMKSRAMAVEQEETEDTRNKINSLNAEFSSSEALAAIDRRAASDDPWWVIRDDDTEDDEDDEDSDRDPRDSGMAQVDPFTKKINSGYGFTAFLIATRMPVPMASLVVALLGFMYIPLFPPREKKDE